MTQKVGSNKPGMFKNESALVFCKARLTVQSLGICTNAAQASFFPKVSRIVNSSVFQVKIYSFNSPIFLLFLSDFVLMN